MPRRNTNSPERDEFGRFTSNNDRYQDRSSRYRDEDDDNGSRYSSRSSRYESEEDDDDNRYSSRSSRSNRGQGWFGDSEGHARAGSMSHGGRGNSRGRSYEEDDDNRYSSRSSRSGNRSRSYDSDEDDDNRYSSRSSRGNRGQGWFGDSEGHVRAGSMSHGGRSSGRDYEDDSYSSSSRRRSDR